MDIFALGSKPIYLFIKVAIPLVIQFNEPMEMAGGNKGTLKIQRMDNKRTYVLKATSNNVDTGMVFFSSDKDDRTRYNITLKHRNKKPHRFVTLREGRSGSWFSVQYENDYFSFMESERSSRFKVKKEGESIIVNGEEVKTSKQFSKNAHFKVRWKKGTKLFNEVSER